MQYSKVLERLQNLIGYIPTQAELCKILKRNQSTMGNRQARDSHFPEKEVEILNSHYGIDIYKDITNSDIQKNNNPQFPSGDRIEIDYWPELPEELKNPKIVSVWFDREIIENAWDMSAEHLCIVPMVGDKMARYWYPIRPNDILIVDTSQDYIMGNGVYFATSRDNTRFWIREMQVLFNNDIEFKGFSPSGDTTKIFSQKQLDEVGFKLIGRVVKNVSFRL